ncbi:MAG: hypothetical protein ACKV1O_26290 [Saprospiraceae bacterium]
MISTASSSLDTTLYFPSIAQNETIRKVIEVVEICLGTFTEKYPISLANRGIMLSDADETDFNTELEHWLSIGFQESSITTGKFTIAREYPESRNSTQSKKTKGLRRQVDLAIRLLNGSRILALEGKRLYTTNDKQYVSGNTGGIARFKREDHGKELVFACMVGYVQFETFNFWQKKINSWIINEQSKSSNLLWNDADLLSAPIEKSPHFAICKSQHQRITQAAIDLCHYWILVV